MKNKIKISIVIDFSIFSIFSGPKNMKNKIKIFVRDFIIVQFFGPLLVVPGEAPGTLAGAFPGTTKTCENRRRGRRRRKRKRRRRPAFFIFENRFNDPRID